MLDAVLEHDRLGNKSELEFVLFHAVTPNSKHRITDLIQFCRSNLFSISKSILGIISLLEYLEIITVKNDSLAMNQKVFDPAKLTPEESYFQKSHFYELLFSKMILESAIKDFLNENSVAYDHQSNKFYIKSHQVPISYFPIRNLLISLCFLEQDRTIRDHLYINVLFAKTFKELVVNEIQKTKRKRAISLKKLKQSLKLKEEAGVKGEIFVLEYERLRLRDHPQIKSIKRISEQYSNAGYDIESFNSLNSYMLDRYIEVKTYSKDIAFYWSRNEVSEAKKLQDKYYLYLVDLTMLSKDGYAPKIFQNPYQKIFLNEIWKKETESWKITLDA